MYTGKYPPYVGDRRFLATLPLRLRQDLPGVPPVQNNLRAFSGLVLVAQKAIDVLDFEHCGHRRPRSASEFKDHLHTTLVEPFANDYLASAEPALATALRKVLDKAIAHVVFAHEMVMMAYTRSEYSPLLHDVAYEMWDRVNGFVQQTIAEANDVTAQFIVKPWEPGPDSIRNAATPPPLPE